MTQFGETSHQVAWVDVLAFAVFSESPNLISRVSHFMSIIVDVATEHAMRLSFGQGKTAAMLEFRGKKAVRERQKMEKQMNNKFQLMSEDWGMVEIPFVQRYKHLGGFIIRGGAKLQEIRVRGVMTMQNLLPLKNILSNDIIAAEKRQMLL